MKLFNLPYLFSWKDKYLWADNAFLSIINRSQSRFDSVSLLQFISSLRNVIPWMFEDPLHFIWLIKPNFLIWCLTVKLCYKSNLSTTISLYVNLYVCVCMCSFIRHKLRSLCKIIAVETNCHTIWVFVVGWTFSDNKHESSCLSSGNVWLFIPMITLNKHFFF